MLGRPCGCRTLGHSPGGCVEPQIRGPPNSLVWNLETLGPPCIQCGTLIRNVGPPMWVQNPRPPPWCRWEPQNRGPTNSLVWNLETLGPPCIRCGTLCCWDWPCEAVQLGGSLRFWAASMSTLLHRCVLLCCCRCPVNLHREQAFDPRPSPGRSRTQVGKPMMQTA
jgi:hypothetical protein